MVFRLMFYSHQAEKMELDQETEQSKALRKKFVSEVTSKQEHKSVFFLKFVLHKSRRQLVPRSVVP